MKSIFTLRVALLAMSLSLATVSSAFAATGHTLKPFHKGLQCESCHQEKMPTAPTVVTCTKCHPAEKVAEQTAPKYKQYYNPHNSLHYATYADCVACHREHSQSRLDCNNSNCHKEFTYTTP